MNEHSAASPKSRNAGGAATPANGGAAHQPDSAPFHAKLQIKKARVAPCRPFRQGADAHLSVCAEVLPHSPCNMRRGNCCINISVSSGAYRAHQDVPGFQAERLLPVWGKPGHAGFIRNMPHAPHRPS